jgi:hypothetical protein
MILIKALPHRSSNYFETVCCAGIGTDGKWRRLYPVPYRILQADQRFGRWNWIEYGFTSPKNDIRYESQKIIPESIIVTKKVSGSQKFQNVRSLIRGSLDEANAKGDSLTLIRPSEVQFKWRAKTETQLSVERLKHAALANQYSMFDQTAKPLMPCPYTFYFFWKDQNGKAHRHTCDDWETSTAFNVRRNSTGSDNLALLSLKNTFEVDYFLNGMVFGFGTHIRRPNQWLLVGVIRVDIEETGSLIFN